MTGHPASCEFYFVRHAPVIKRSGHVPPADPPIEERDFKLERLVDLLPTNADWHISPLLRTRQTAALLTPSLKPASTTMADALVEMDFGEWHDQPISHVWPEIARGPLHNWSFITAETHPPAGESFAMVADRVRYWMEDRANQFSERPQIIIAHGGVIRAAIAALLNAPAERVVGIPVAHFGLLRASLMDPAAATNQGGSWLFSGLFDPGVC